MNYYHDSNQILCSPLHQNDKYKFRVLQFIQIQKWERRGPATVNPKTCFVRFHIFGVCVAQRAVGATSGHLFSLNN